MNVRSALMDTIRRFTARHRSPRVVEKRTYVFILVPFDFRGNGHAKKAEVPQNLIDNGSHDNSAQTDTLSTLTILDSAGAKTTPDRDVKDDQELNYDLMWTWFLPNPLWPPKKRE
jgi:hypothetical protein